MHKYTLIFVKCHDEILLLNCQKGMWMGMWNGVGGKIEANETPLEGALRETFEETGLKLDHLTLETIVTWEVLEDQSGGGMYVFTGEVENRDCISVPCYSPAKEGILDWKKVDWILSAKNQGIIKNITYFLPDILQGNVAELYHCVYQNHTLIRIEKNKIHEQ